jgi:cobalt/nickel transport system permease protein
LICAVIASVALASLQDVTTLAIASVLPAALLFADVGSGSRVPWRAMGGVNRAGAVIWLLLPFTYPGERVFGVLSADGLRMALLTMWRLNLMSAVLIRLVTSMGVPRITDALGRLGVPLKLRMLVLLSVRYIFLLADRAESMWRAVSLRSPGISGLYACKCLACVVGTLLIRSSDRAERSALAMSLRGGISGFSQERDTVWKPRDSMLCAVFLLYMACLAALSSSAVLIA